MSARQRGLETPMTETFTRLTEGDNVIIQVELSVFAVPRNLVEHYSQHLKASMSSQTFNRQPRIRLVHQRADVFGAIVQWMLGGGALNSRVVAERFWKSSSQSPAEAADSMGRALCDIYFMAGRLLIAELQTDALAQLKKHFAAAHGVMTPQMVEMIYDKTPDNSPLRKLLVASLARAWRLRWGAPTRDYQHVFKRFPEFAVAMVDAGFGRTGGRARPRS